MDLRTDSVNDVLKHYGLTPKTGKVYIANALAHKFNFTIPIGNRKNEEYEKQRKAELQLYNAKAEKLTADINRFSDDITKHCTSSFRSVSNQQTAADRARSQFYNAQRTRDIRRISATESAAKTLVNNVNSTIDKWDSVKDGLIKKVTVYEDRVANLINQRPNNDHSEVLYTSQAVTALENALNKLIYNRDALKSTHLYKITI